jgi:hypothetical protein
MALDFPGFPANGQTFGGYTYDAAKGVWAINASTITNMTVSDTAPSNPLSGDSWFDSTTGYVFVYYTDANSSQWIQTTGAYIDTALTNRVTTIESSKPLSPNYVINGAFDIMQRSSTPTTGLAAASGVGYQFDRWTGQHASTATISRQASSYTGIPFCARVQRNSGNTNTASPIRFSQSIETLESTALAGSTVTFSFYARKGANFSDANSQITAAVYSGTGTDQNLLSGFTGNVNTIAQTPTLTTFWQRFVYTATVSAATTQLGVDFYYYGTGTAGANDYFEVTGVQLEAGSAATSFRRNSSSIQTELATCQRYYQRMTQTGVETLFGAGVQRTTTTGVVVIHLPVTLRVAPTSVVLSNVNIGDQTNFNAVATLTDFSRSTPSALTLLVSYAANGAANRPMFIQGRNGTPYDAVIEVIAEL